MKLLKKMLWLCISYFLGYVLNILLSPTEKLKISGNEIFDYEKPFIYILKYEQIVTLLFITLIIGFFSYLFYRKDKRVIKILRNVLFIEICFFLFSLGTLGRVNFGFIQKIIEDIKPLSIKELMVKIICKIGNIIEYLSKKYVLFSLLFISFIVFLTEDKEENNVDILNPDEKLYKSREIYIKVIEEHLENMNSFSIIGKWGIGKTKLIRNFFYGKLEYKDKYEVIYIDSSIYSQNEKLISVLEKELNRILEKYGYLKLDGKFIKNLFLEDNGFLKIIYRFMFGDISLRENKKELEEKLEEIKNRKKEIVVCLDNIERLNSRKRITEILAILDEILPSSVKRIYIYDEEHLKNIFEKDKYNFFEYINKYIDNKIEIKECSLDEVLKNQNDADSGEDIKEELKKTIKKIKYNKDRIMKEINKDFENLIAILKAEKNKLEIEKKILSDKSNNFQENKLMNIPLEIDKNIENDEGLKLKFLKKEIERKQRLKINLVEEKEEIKLKIKDLEKDQIKISQTEKELRKIEMEIGLRTEERDQEKVSYIRRKERLLEELEKLKEVEENLIEKRSEISLIKSDLKKIEMEISLRTEERDQEKVLYMRKKRLLKRLDELEEEEKVLREKYSKISLIKSDLKKIEMEISLRTEERDQEKVLYMRKKRLLKELDELRKVEQNLRKKYSEMAQIESKLNELEKEIKSYTQEEKRLKEVLKEKIENLQKKINEKEKSINSKIEKEKEINRKIEIKIKEIEEKLNIPRYLINLKKYIDSKSNEKKIIIVAAIEYKLIRDTFLTLNFDDIVSYEKIENILGYEEEYSKALKREVTFFEDLRVEDKNIEKLLAQELFKEGKRDLNEMLERGIIDISLKIELFKKFNQKVDIDKVENLNKERKNLSKNFFKVVDTLSLEYNFLKNLEEILKEDFIYIVDEEGIDKLLFSEEYQKCFNIILNKIRIHRGIKMEYKISYIKSIESIKYLILYNLSSIEKRKFFIKLLEELQMNKIINIKEFLNKEFGNILKKDDLNDFSELLYILFNKSQNELEVITDTNKLKNAIDKYKNLCEIIELTQEEKNKEEKEERKSIEKYIFFCRTLYDHLKIKNDRLVLSKNDIPILPDIEITKNNIKLYLEDINKKDFTKENLYKNTDFKTRREILYNLKIMKMELEKFEQETIKYN